MDYGWLNARTRGGLKRKNLRVFRQRYRLPSIPELRNAAADIPSAGKTIQEKEIKPRETFNRKGINCRNVIAVVFLN